MKTDTTGNMELLAHLRTTDARIDPGHANSIMLLAAAEIESLDKQIDFWKESAVMTLRSIGP